MVGTVSRTGKILEEPDHIRQSLGIILKPPKGTRVMRREFGFDGLIEDGSVKDDVTKESAERSALAAILEYEPRIEDVSLDAVMSDERLKAFNISYQEKKSGDRAAVTIEF